MHSSCFPGGDRCQLCWNGLPALRRFIFRVARERNASAVPRRDLSEIRELREAEEAATSYAGNGNKTTKGGSGGRLLETTPSLHASTASYIASSDGAAPPESS